MSKITPLIVCLALFSSHFTFGQVAPGAGTRPSTTIPPSVSPAKGNGRLTGTVVDASNNQPVGFATVTLTDATGKAVDGTLCDDKGKFTLPKLAAGNFKLVVSFIGYQSNTQDVTVANREITLGTIRLSPSAQALKEVQVQGQRAMIEEKVDRTVYNAENDISNRGGDATDVLRKVPMLSVDLDGNVSMRGSSNLRVLINNRPSTITAGSVADALKQIPADLIKSVEVITSPSAKYDAEGSGGIINIILKRNTLQGGTLGVDIGAGLRGSNLGLNGSYRKGKMGFSLGGFGRANYNTTGSFENEQTTRSALTLAPLATSTQSADTRNNGLFGRYSLGWDYDIDKYNFINASVQYGVRNGQSFQDRLFTSRDFAETSRADINTLQDVEVTDNSGTVDVNFNYTRAFDKPQQELSLLTQFSRNNRTNNFLNENFNLMGTSILDRLKNINESFNQESTIQLDYTNPIGKNQIVEFGGKEIYRQVISDFQTFESVGTGAFTPSTRRSLSNVFNYNQNVVGGYISYTLTTAKQYSIKPGLRYEYTTINADFKDSSTDLPIPSYGVLVPSLNLSKRLKAGNTVKLSYNRRIQRPSLQFLNPNRQAANPLIVTIGNPELDPEYTNNFELGYNTYINRTSLNFSTFVRSTNNSIQSIRDVSGDTIRTTFQNIGKEDAYGFSIFGNINISNKLTLNAGTDSYYAVLNNNVADPIYAASNRGWVFNIRGMGNYTIGQGWGVQGFGFYRARQVQLQGTQGGFGIYSLGLRKDIREKKGSIGFGIENFLGTSITIRNELNSPILNQTSTDVRNNLSFRATFSYRIGKISADNQSRRRRKSVNNDDMKGGGGDQDGGAAPSGGAPAGGAPGGAPGQGQRPGGGAPGQGQRPGGAPGQMQRPGGAPGTTALGTTNAPGTTPDSSAAPTTPTDSAQATAPAGTGIAGVWQGKMGQFDLTMNLAAEGEKLTGMVKTPMGETPITDGKIMGNDISFSIIRQGNIIPYTGKFIGNTLNISVNFNGRVMEGVLQRAQ